MVPIAKIPSPIAQPPTGAPRELPGARERTPQRVDPDPQTKTSCFWKQTKEKKERKNDSSGEGDGATTAETVSKPGEF